MNGPIDLDRQALALHLQPTTEREIENAIRDAFLSAGWHPVKTDAGQITRGQKPGGRARGHIRRGFPDMTFLLGLPGTGLCVAALVEVKTATGKLRPEQVQMHAELRAHYGIEPHVLRSPQEARALIQTGRHLQAALRLAAEAQP